MCDYTDFTMVDFCASAVDVIMTYQPVIRSAYYSNASYMVKAVMWKIPHVAKNIIFFDKDKENGKKKYT